MFVCVNVALYTSTTYLHCFVLVYGLIYFVPNLYNSFFFVVTDGVVCRFQTRVKNNNMKLTFTYVHTNTGTQKQPYVNIWHKLKMIVATVKHQINPINIGIVRKLMATKMDIRSKPNNKEVRDVG